MRKTTDLSQAVGDFLKERGVLGSVFVSATDDAVFLSGEVNDPELARQVLASSTLLEGRTLKTALRTPPMLHVVNVSEKRDASELPPLHLDRLPLIFQGSIPTHLIETHNDYRRRNPTSLEKLRNIMAPRIGDSKGKKRRPARLIAPLILDSKLRIIDGMLRLEAAQSLKLSEVPVIVIGGDRKRTDALRIALNKSAEYQRFLWDDVDVYLERKKESRDIALMKTLETLGVFGEQLLPETFFGNTITDYVIHSDHNAADTQQRFYRQERGLAKWAKAARRLRKKQEAKKEEKRKAREAKREALLKAQEELSNPNVGLFS